MLILGWLLLLWVQRIGRSDKLLLLLWVQWVGGGDKLLLLLLSRLLGIGCKRIQGRWRGVGVLGWRQRHNDIRVSSMSSWQQGRYIGSRIQAHIGHISSCWLSRHGSRRGCDTVKVHVGWWQRQHAGRLCLRKRLGHLGLLLLRRWRHDSTP